MNNPRKNVKHRRSQKQVKVKEITLRPKTNDHHTSFKVKNARGWLEEGDKVKVRIRFRGREITYPEVALKQLKDIAADLMDIAVVEQISTTRWAYDAYDISTKKEEVGRRNLLCRKIKTHKSASKRFRMTKGGKGKLMRTKQGKSHFRRKKPRRVRAQFAKVLIVENDGIVNAV